MTRGEQLVLRARPGGPDPARALRIARHGLGLSEAESERLLTSLPLVLSLRPMSDESSDRLFDRLQSAGFEFEHRPVSVDFPECPSHPQLAASESCPECKDARACAACVYLQERAQCARCRGRQGFWRRFRHLRIALLLLVLGFVSLATIHEERRIRSWTAPISVVVYPIAASGDEEVTEYIDALQDSHLDPVETFFAQEAERLDAPARAPLALRIGPTLANPPPAAPQTNAILDALLFSLKLRWYGVRAPDEAGAEAPDLRVFWVLHPTDGSGSLDHSVGLERGHVAVVHGFASEDMLGANHVVIAHELLHLVGATDKYELESGTPVYPEGYAEPALEPRYPQSLAEIMGGRIPVSAEASKMPKDLSECRVGPATAREISWAE